MAVSSGQNPVSTASTAASEHIDSSIGRSTFISTSFPTSRATDVPGRPPGSNEQGRQRPVRTLAAIKPSHEVESVAKHLCREFPDGARNIPRIIDDLTVHLQGSPLMMAAALVALQVCSSLTESAG